MRRDEMRDEKNGKGSRRVDSNEKKTRKDEFK